jgi:hypothetical protein
MSLVMLKALTWDLVACALLCQLRGSSLSGRRCRRGIDSASSVLPLSEANQLPSWSKTLPSGSVHLGTHGIRGAELSTTLPPCGFGRWSCYFRSDDSAPEGRGAAGTTAVCVGACRVNTECLNSILFEILIPHASDSAGSGVTVQIWLADRLVGDRCVQRVQSPRHSGSIGQVRDDRMIAQTLAARLVRGRNVQRVQSMWPQPGQPCRACTTARHARTAQFGERCRSGTLGPGGAVAGARPL